MTTHEVLVAARNLIDREGWYQGGYGGEGTGYCMMGATGMVENGTSYVGCRRADLELADALGPPYVLATFNDTVGRTKEEVLAVFDKAIAATAPEPDIEKLIEERREDSEFTERIERLVEEEREVLERLA